MWKPFEKGFTEERFYQFPSIVNIEVLRGACPCKCSHCPVGQVKAEDRCKRFGVDEMKLALFKSITNEVALHEGSSIRFHSVGEPLLWKHLETAANYAKSKGVTTWIFTSLITSNGDFLRSLCESISIIEVSVNSTNAEDYLSTKGIDSFNIVLNNLRMMSEHIRNSGLSTRLVVSRVQSDDADEDAAFLKFWNDSGLVADAFIRRYHNYNHLLEDKFDVPKARPICLVHFMRLNVSCNGSVVTCFNELFKEYLRDDTILGDLSHQSIVDVWHGDKIEKIRMAEIHGYDMYEDQFTADFPCRICTSCQPYSKDYATSERQIEMLKEQEHCT